MQEAFEVLVPAQIPPWLWGGDRSMSSSGFKLKYDPPIGPLSTEAPPVALVTAGSRGDEDRMLVVSRSLHALDLHGIAGPATSSASVTK